MKSRWLAPILLLLLLLLILVLLLIGSQTHYPVNAGLKEYDPGYGYRFSRYYPADKEDQHFLILTFSGGGTRAAALAHGILLELEKTPIAPGRTLLDEVDVISAASGGSFTAMYFALYGKKGLSSFEQDFLRKDIQGALKRSLKSPRNLLRIASPHFSRRPGRGALRS